MNEENKKFDEVMSEARLDFIKRQWKKKFGYDLLCSRPEPEVQISYDRNKEILFQERIDSVSGQPLVHWMMLTKDRKSPKRKIKFSYKLKRLWNNFLNKLKFNILD